MRIKVTGYITEEQLEEMGLSLPLDQAGYDVLMDEMEGVLDDVNLDVVSVR